jgi:hypothetical protein
MLGVCLLCLSCLDIQAPLAAQVPSLAFHYMHQSQKCASSLGMVAGPCNPSYSEAGTERIVV